MREGLMGEGAIITDNVCIEAYHHIRFGTAKIRKRMPGAFFLPLIAIGTELLAVKLKQSVLKKIGKTDLISCCFKTAKDAEEAQRSQRTMNFNSGTYQNYFLIKDQIIAKTFMYKKLNFNNLRSLCFLCDLCG